MTAKHTEDRSVECSECGKTIEAGGENPTYVFKVKNTLRNGLKIHLVPLEHIREGEYNADREWLCNNPCKDRWLNDE